MMSKVLMSPCTTMLCDSSIIILGSTRQHSSKILPIVKICRLQSIILCTHLSSGMSSNTYGEPAWPNDILYIFPVLILGVVTSMLGVSLSHPLEIMCTSNALSTPLEIVPEWYLLVSFNLLRITPSKLLGVLSMISLILIVLKLCIIENLNIHSSPFRRPIMITHLNVYIVYALWLNRGYISSIKEALPLI